MYVIITNIDVLNSYNLSFSEFDDLSQNDKLKIEHDTFSIPELIENLNDYEFNELYNPEYNIYTLIYEE